jgi:hypothetical protein
MMESLLQQGPAQTQNFMIAGFTVIFGMIGFYILSLIIRCRMRNREISALQELVQELDQEKPSISIRADI